MQLAYNWGKAELPEDGAINEEVVQAFTNGHCHSFALAMHQETGWPIFGIGVHNDSPMHCVVYCPQLDEYIDIEGPGAKQRCWQLFDSVELVEAGRVADLKWYRKPEPDAARPFVKTVLQSLPEKAPHITKDLLTI